MSKKTLHKAAGVAAAIIVPATVLTVTSEAPADASVYYSCGKNWDPVNTTDVFTLESIPGRSEGAMGDYPGLWLRDGLEDGLVLVWDRLSKSFYPEMQLDLNWWSSANGATHMDCRWSLFGGSGRLYGEAVPAGLNPTSTAYGSVIASYYWPCIRAIESDGGGHMEPGPWACAPWYNV